MGNRYIFSSIPKLNEIEKWMQESTVAYLTVDIQPMFPNQIGI